MTYACWRCVKREVAVPGEECATCIDSQERKARRLMERTTPDERDEVASYRRFWRDTVSLDDPGFNRDTA